MGSNAPHSQIDVGANPHLCMDDWSLPTLVRLRLSRTQAGLSRHISGGLALALGQKGVALTDLQSTSRLIYSQSIVQLKCLV